MSTAPPGWWPDPFGRARYRYWDGASWMSPAWDGLLPPAEGEDNEGDVGPGGCWLNDEDDERLARWFDGERFTELTAVKEDWIDEPPAPPKPPPKQQRCPACGLAAPTGSFCSACGSSLTGLERPAALTGPPVDTAVREFSDVTSSPLPTDPKVGWAFGAVVALMAVAVLVGWVAWWGHQSSSGAPDSTTATSVDHSTETSGDGASSGGQVVYLTRDFPDGTWPAERAATLQQTINAACSAGASKVVLTIIDEGHHYTSAISDYTTPAKTSTQVETC